MAQFTSKLTAAEREEIITRAAFRETPASIHAAIAGKVSLRTVQRIVKAEAQDIASRRRTLEHERGQREREEQHLRSRREEPLQYEPHALPQALEPEPRYASELGPNARERVGALDGREPGPARVAESGKDKTVRRFSRNLRRGQSVNVLGRACTGRSPDTSGGRPGRRG
jgi:hypothetical protein